MANLLLLAGRAAIAGGISLFFFFTPPYLKYWLGVVLPDMVEESDIMAIRADLAKTIKGSLESAGLENEDFVFTHYRVDTEHDLRPTFSNVDKVLVGKNIEALLDAVLEKLGDITGLNPGEIWFTNLGVSWAGRKFELSIYEGVEQPDMAEDNEVMAIRADLIRTVEGGLKRAKLDGKDFVFTHFRVDTAHASRATFSVVDSKLVGKNIEAFLDAVLGELDVTGFEPGEIWFTNIGVSWLGRELELFVYDG